MVEHLFYWLQISEMSKNHHCVIAQKDEELSSLRESITTQQQQFECSLKQKTEAFTKVQTEMQRLMDEAAADSKKQLSSLKEVMSKQQNSYEQDINTKLEEFAKVKEELQTTIDATNNQLELVS